MTVNLFIMLLTLGATASSLLTEALKKALSEAKKGYSANALALMDALIVGGGGTALAYVFLGIPWTVNNSICVVLMAVCVWVGSMIGYDKVLQLIQQIGAKG